MTVAILNVDIETQLSILTFLQLHADTPKLKPVPHLFFQVMLPTCRDKQTVCPNPHLRSMTGHKNKHIKISSDFLKVAAHSFANTQNSVGPQLEICVRFCNFLSPISLQQLQLNEIFPVPDMTKINLFCCFSRKTNSNRK